MREIVAELVDRQEAALGHKRQVLKDLVDAKLMQPSAAQDLWQDMNRPTPLFGGIAPALPTAPASARPQVIAGVVAPKSSAPPAPRFQGGGPAATGTAAPAAGQSAIGPATNAPNRPNRPNAAGSTAAGTTGPTPNTARPKPAGASAASPNTGTTGPAPRFSSGTGSGTGPAAGSGRQNPGPPAPAQSGGSQGSATNAPQGSTTGNVVGAVPVGRKNRPNRSGT